MEVIIHALITTKLDYCNSLMYGLTKRLLSKLQSVQNSAAQIVTLSRKYNHITPLLIQLHWLPIHHRIVFKNRFQYTKSFLQSLAQLRIYDVCIIT